MPELAPVSRMRRRGGGAELAAEEDMGRAEKAGDRGMLNAGMEIPVETTMLRLPPRRAFWRSIPLTLILVGSGGVAAALLPIGAAQAQHSEEVRFRPGDDGTMLSGSVDFNVLPQGSTAEEIVVGSMQAEKATRIILPSSGESTLRVVLMGNDRDTDQTVSSTSTSRFSEARGQDLSSILATAVGQGAVNRRSPGAGIEGMAVAMARQQPAHIEIPQPLH